MREVSLARSHAVPPAILAAVAELSRRRRLILLCLLVGALLATAAWLRFGRRYAAFASFIALSSGRSLPSSLAGVASQFGVSLPSSNDGESPQFYSGLVQTRILLSRVLHTHLLSGGRQTTLRELFTRDTTAKGEAKAVRDLRKVIEVDIDSRTGMLRVGMRLRDPELAAAGANAVVEEVGRLNAEIRQEQGRAKRGFVEDRLRAARAGLDSAERNLRDFYVTNRSWNGSPALVYAEGLLRRQVQLTTDLYVSLNREYEGARMQELNSTPTITMVDPATPPVDPEGIMAAWVILGAILGLLFGIAWVLISAWWLLAKVAFHDPGVRLSGNLQSASA